MKTQPAGVGARYAGAAMFGFVMLVVLCLLPSLASANPPEYSSVVSEAIGAQEAGDYARARALFAQAHALDPSARTLRGLGVAAFQDGDFVEAVLDLSAALAHPNKPLEGELRANIVALLDVARASVASYRVESTPREATLLVDDRAPTLDVEGKLLLAPGLHTVTLSAPGYAEQRIELEARAGTHENVRAVLAAATQVSPLASDLSVVAPSAPPEPLPITGPIDEDGRTPRLRRAMWTSAAAGGAFAVTAGVMSLIGYLRARSIEEKCGEECEEALIARETEKANLKQLARGVNVTGAIAIAGLGASLGLWLWQRPSAGTGARVSLTGQELSYSLRF